MEGTDLNSTHADEPGTARLRARLAAGVLVLGVVGATGCAALDSAFDSVAGYRIPRKNSAESLANAEASANPAQYTAKALVTPGGAPAADPFPAASDQWGYGNQDSTLAFVTDTPVSSGQGFAPVRFGGDPIPTGGRSIGVFGEPDAHASLVANSYDGAGNLSQITHAAEGACFDPDVSRDGRFMLFASTQHRKTSDIYLKSTTGMTMTQITADPADDVMPAFGPDGNRVAFSSNRDGNWNIYITTIDGSPALQLTSDSDHELHPTWSPDGLSIAYCKLGSQSGRWEIWVTDLNTRVPQFLEYGLFPQWNPDPMRNKITFQRARERGSRLFSIWTIDYIGGEAMHPTEIVSAANAAAMQPAWSPDGSRIVFVTVVDPDMTGDEEPQQADVWVVNLDGTSKTNLTKGRFRNLYPAWSADNNVFFLSNRSGVDNIWAVATNRTMMQPAAPEQPLVTVDPETERVGDRP